MKYVIMNPNRCKWDVYKASEYEAASEGMNVFSSELKERLRGIRIARFKTRRAAREYVTSIGGTY